MSDILQLLSTALTILGVLAFATSVIVQTIKDIPELKEFPTQLVTLFVAEIITTMSLFAGCAYYSSRYQCHSDRRNAESRCG